MDIEKIINNELEYRYKGSAINDSNILEIKEFVKLRLGQFGYVTDNLCIDVEGDTDTGAIDIKVYQNIDEENDGG